MYKLQNDRLEVALTSLGAELKSVKDSRTAYEFMWQGDPSVWGRTAPVLFPFVGKSKDDRYTYKDTSYPMGQHGFARDLEFNVEEHHDQRIVFVLHADERTLQQYPFSFTLKLSYELHEDKLTCGYEVTNTGDHDMFFSIGAHPGFNLPSKKLSDHCIEFGHEENVDRYLLSEGLMNGQTMHLQMDQDKLLLDPSLFDHDAIVLKHIRSEQIRLRSLSSSFNIGMRWHGFPFLGIWTKNGCEEFICLEPWCGIADQTAGYPDLSEKEGMNRLEPKQAFHRAYSITFTA